VDSCLEKNEVSDTYLSEKNTNSDAGEKDYDRTNSFGNSTWPNGVEDGCVVAVTGEIF